MESTQMGDALFIGGVWRNSTTREQIPVVNPATEEVIGFVPAGSEEDAAIAVAAANAGGPGWASRKPDERAVIVAELANEIERRAGEITDIVVRELGAPCTVAGWLHVGFGVLDLRGAVDAVSDVAWEERRGPSLVVREPIGVATCITPWNYPLHQITAKVGAALVAGSTVVLKASEVAPFTARAFAECVEAVGVPAGVFNLVHGRGAVVGEALVSHPDVAVVSFTGSTAVGRRVAALASDTVKRVALELGGKSASVVLDDADLEQACKLTLRNAYQNAGQSCNAQTRMLVPRRLLAEVEERTKAVAEAYTVGDPTDARTKMGPLVSESQRSRVLGYITEGLNSGARLITGGTERPDGLDVGYYVRPTVFSDVDPGSRIAQEEIFGPVVSLIPYDLEDEAIRIANDTIYGIGGGVWSADVARAEAVARQLQTAQVDLNGGSFNPAAPFGGYKQSGLGRENGTFGIEEYLEVKSIQMPVSAASRP